ncbi:MAG: SLBB domain-containing protein, partial [Nitrospira sp.]|nr:SLBB domain-containing protein [Nitrospira sp.]
IWGKVNIEYKSLIDNDGKANLPTIGVIQLSGLNFREAKSLIEKEFNRYFTDIKMNISMGSLRSIRVFVVGNARRPGSYTLSSFSTIINALFAAGGPSKAGSMRNIQLKRNGQADVTLDLYDFILHGDKTNDIRLLPEDVIFIPPAGMLVGIAGNVKVPAIYEIKEDTRLSDLLEMTGGVSGISFKNRVQVLRVGDAGDQNLIEINLSEVEKGKENDITLRDGDLVKIFTISQTVEKLVHISGAVKAQGTYGYREGMTVKDLLTYSGGLLRYSNKEEAELTRVNITTEGPKTERIIVKLNKAMEGDPQLNISLKEDDYLFVRTVPEWGLYRTIAVTGEVKFPGTYTINKGETLSSLIERAGGFTDKAYLKGTVFTRVSVRDLQQKQLNESIDRLEQEIMSQSARTIEAALTPEEAQQQKAAEEQRKGLITKMRAVKAKGVVSIKLDRLEIFKNSYYDIPLEDGDTLYVPEQPHQVQVIGAVYNPTAFVYNPGWSVESYLKYAGGMTRNAEYDDIYILKMDGTAISKRGWSGNPDTGGGWFFKGSFMSSTLDPGDTIVIPEKIERIAWLKEIKDLTQILYQIAVTAGVLIRVL